MWTYKKPTTPGWYHVNQGDVVTKEALEFVLLSDVDGLLCDDKLCPVSEYNECYKFKTIDYDFLNKIGNE